MENKGNQKKPIAKLVPTKHKKGSVGYKAEKLASKQFAFYQDLLESHPKDMAKDIAGHSIQLKLLIAEFAIKAFDRKVKESQDGK